MLFAGWNFDFAWLAFFKKLLLVFLNRNFEGWFLRLYFIELCYRTKKKQKNPDYEKCPFAKVQIKTEGIYLHLKIMEPDASSDSFKFRTGLHNITVRRLSSHRFTNEMVAIIIYRQIKNAYCLRTGCFVCTKWINDVHCTWTVSLQKFETKPIGISLTEWIQYFINVP